MNHEKTENDSFLGHKGMSSTVLFYLTNGPKQKKYFILL